MKENMPSANAAELLVQLAREAERLKIEVERLNARIAELETAQAVES